MNILGITLREIHSSSKDKMEMINDAIGGILNGLVDTQLSEFVSIFGTVLFLYVSWRLFKYLCELWIRKVDPFYEPE